MCEGINHSLDMHQRQERRDVQQ